MFVYVLKSSGGMCKIGIAKHVRSRLDQLTTGHPYALEIAETFEVADHLARSIEARAHALLAEKRMKGEWFTVEAEAAADVVKQAIELCSPPPRPATPEIVFPKCQNCDFFRVDSSCHRRAPLGNEVTGSAWWPRVGPDDLCGEYEESDL